MNILHYCLGFPPFRRGGMVKYCIDLMQSQKELGHNVGMLWPGRYIDSKPSCKIIKRKSIDGIKSYELINALPVPLLDGIAEPQYFTVLKDKKVFSDFIKNGNIDVIHIHTLMGLPCEMVEAANDLGVRTVFTSHDFFGICPNGSLMQGAELCTDDHNCKDCVICCKDGLSINKIKFLQSGLYRKIKNSSFLRLIRKQHLRKHRGAVDNIMKDAENPVRKSSVTESEITRYKSLRHYYISLLKRVDILHFNSSQSCEIYSKYFDLESRAHVLTISNSTIKDYKEIKQLGSVIRIGYLGPIVGSRKGYFDLYNVLIDLYNQGYNNFELHIYNQMSSAYSFLICHEPYNANQLSTVMKNIDVLVVPSVWYETFGFTVLEAMSYGVPVVVSSHVGAKDLIINGTTGVIYEQGEEELKCVIKNILDRPQVISELNKNILHLFSIKTMDVHTKEIIRLYQ